MKIVFFGNADFGCKTLEALCSNDNHHVVGVVTNSDKKRGRNLKLLPTPIKRLSQKLNLNIIENDNLKDPNLVYLLDSLNADIFIVIAYKIMPKEIYSIPKFGSINLHASLLPAYKGAAPIQRAIINDEKHTGLSTFFLNNSVDGGKLINQIKININDDDTFENVWTNLNKISPEFVVNTLQLIIKKQTNIINDLTIKECFAPKIRKEELKINWNEPNHLIHNKVRAFYPFPSMYTYLENKRIKILKTSISDYVEDSFKIGEIVIIENKLFVKCGVGFIEISMLQPDSKKEMKSSDFINGFTKLLKQPLNVFK
tara:strand:+ start:736 stop:1674 length:939 start_codon:yes stop_codon:yes gene_type:complete